MDATFWAFVGLICFVGVLYYYKIPDRITAALDNRSEEIRTEIEDARKLREEAQSLLAEYRRKVRNAEQDAEDIIKQAKLDAKRLAEETERNLEDMLVRRTKAAEEKIAQAQAQAIEDVKTRASDVAIAAATQILGEKMQGPDGDTLLDQSIKDVGKLLN